MFLRQGHLPCCDISCLSWALGVGEDKKRQSQFWLEPFCEFQAISWLQDGPFCLCWLFLHICTEYVAWLPVRLWFVCLLCPVLHRLRNLLVDMVLL